MLLAFCGQRRFVCSPNLQCRLWSCHHKGEFLYLCRAIFHALDFLGQEHVFEWHFNHLWFQLFGQGQPSAEGGGTLSIVAGSGIFCFSFAQRLHDVIPPSGKDQVEHIVCVLLLNPLDHIARLDVSDHQNFWLVGTLQLCGVQAQHDKFLFKHAASVHVHFVQLQVSPRKVATGREVPDLSLGPNHKRHVVVHTVDRRPEVLWLCPSSRRVSRGAVNVMATHALEAVGSEEDCLAVGRHKRRDLVSPCVHPRSKGLQLAPASVFIQRTLVQVKASLAFSPFEARNQAVFLRKKHNFPFVGNGLVEVQRLCNCPASLPTLGGLQLMGPTVVVEHHELLAKSI